MQVWKSAYHWNPGVRAFDVLSARLSGLCAECASWLRAKRRLATALMIVPFVLLAACVATGPIGFVAMGLYGLYLVRSMTYGFADSMLYGGELHDAFLARIPHHVEVNPSNESVRFPAGTGHAVTRLGLAAILGFAAAFLAVMVASYGGGQSEDDTLELLSRPSKAYVITRADSEKLATTELEGRRVATAYTSFEALPQGTALEIAPYMLFERALADESVEAIAFDPGPNSLVVVRKRFKHFKRHLPEWQTEVKTVTKLSPPDPPPARR